MFEFRAQADGSLSGRHFLINCFQRISQETKTSVGGKEERFIFYL
jgi:hypothetical protein